MKLTDLFRVTKEDNYKVLRILVECFREDPLYQKLIPKREERMRMLPELMECDAEEMLDICDVYADSPEINSLVIVDDDTEQYHYLSYYAKEAFYALKADAFLVKEDMSLKTLWNFLIGRQYLNAAWTRELPQERRMHLIYFAVRPAFQGTGLAHRTILPVLRYADREGIHTSLETHNAKNLPIYAHYGFTLFRVMESHFHLRQFCLVREPETAQRAAP